MLHVLSEETIKKHNYYYVRQVNGKWEKTVIRSSNHQWNSGYLKHAEDGTICAYLITGEGYLKAEPMGKHGGGRIEEWISKDKGKSWKQSRDLTPDEKKYPGWLFSNIQPVVRPDNTHVDGMLIFYGFKDHHKPDAKAFLLIEE